MGQYARIKKEAEAQPPERRLRLRPFAGRRLHVPPRRALWGSGLLRQLFDAEHAAQHKAHEPVCVKYDNLHAYGHSPFCRVRRRLPRLHVFAQPSGARAIRAALRRSAADDHDAERHHDDRSDKQCEPRGADARKDHAEAEGSGAHGALAAIRKAAVQAELRFTQNRHLRFPETRPEGLFQYIRKCRNVLHGTAPRAFRAFPMVLALTPSACRARRSRSRC